VADDVVFGVADVPAAVGVWPSTVARLGSAANWADTPDELVQAEFGDPTPATKFTCMHYSSQESEKCVLYRAQSRTLTKRLIQDYSGVRQSTTYLIMHAILRVLDDLE
jgi:hypothetical protein